jgi:hypothetical protein
MSITATSADADFEIAITAVLIGEHLNPHGCAAIQLFTRSLPERHAEEGAGRHRGPDKNRPPTAIGTVSDTMYPFDGARVRSSHVAVAAGRFRFECPGAQEAEQVGREEHRSRVGLVEGEPKVVADLPGTGRRYEN